MISKEDRATLWTLWESEPAGDSAWRAHLNEEQAELVAFWDWAFRGQKKEEAEAG